VGAGGLILVLGCMPVDHRAADLQLDLPGSQPPEADIVRVCVEGVGYRDFGARLSGRFTMTGLPVGEPAQVQVDVYDSDETLLVSGQGLVQDYLLGIRLDCAAGAVCEPCLDEGGPAPDPEDSWLLAVRFLG